METLFYLDNRLAGFPSSSYFQRYDSFPNRQEQETLQFLLDDYDDRKRRQAKRFREEQQQDEEGGAVRYEQTLDRLANSQTPPIAPSLSPSRQTSFQRQEIMAPERKSGLQVFPTETLRLVMASGYLTAPEAGSFILLVSKEFCSAVGRDFVWKTLCCQYWPVVSNNEITNGMDYQAIFSQLLRPARLRTYDYHPSMAPASEQQQHCCRDDPNQHLSSPMDSLSFSVTIRGDDGTPLQSHCLTLMEMKQLLETGSLSIPNTFCKTTTNNPKIPPYPPRAAYWHVWRRNSSSRQNVDNATVCCCLNESHLPVWNAERQAFQFLTKYVRFSSRGRHLEHSLQNQEAGFGGFKFQIFVSSADITLEIRKRHGRHPAGLYRETPNNVSIGILDLLQELAGWEN